MKKKEKKHTQPKKKKYETKMNEIKKKHTDTHMNERQSPKWSGKKES